MRAERRPLLQRALGLSAVMVIAHVLALAALVLAGRTAHAAAQREVRAAPPSAAPIPVPAPIEWGGVLDLQTRLKDLQVEVGRDGRRVWVVDTPNGPLRLTPDEFTQRTHEVQAQQRANGVLYVIFNITTPLGFLWVAIGFLGQVLFTLRMVLQWHASEKEKRSVVPIGFWWGSLFGGLMLFVYFIWRKDIVGILGQSTGIFIYARNLVLIYRSRRAPAPGTGTAEAPAV